MTEEVTKEPLTALAAQIAEHAETSDEHVIEAAMLLRELRRRVDDGEAGDVTWYAWARANIHLSDSRLRELQRLAAAEDPKKELERQRTLTRERVERHRDRKQSEARQLEEERKALIARAKEAPLEQVRRALEVFSGPADDIPADLDSTPQPARLHAA